MEDPESDLLLSECEAEDDECVIDTQPQSNDHGRYKCCKYTVLCTAVGLGAMVLITTYDL